MKFLLLACGSFLLLMSWAAPASAERRVALVVGNGAYQHATRLRNPGHDAVDVAAALKRLDFDVTVAVDLDSDNFGRVIDKFTARLQQADVALFYYSGHGLQFDNINYLVPVDAQVEGAFSLKRKTVSAQDVVDLMERNAKVSLVFLDACRNNTLTRDLEQILPQSGSAATGRGLARMTTTGNNTLIVFATAPDTVAEDGTDRNSPFSGALLKHIETPGVVIQEMLTDVAADVGRATLGKQRPELLSRLTTKVRLNQAIVTPVPQSSPAVTSRERDAQIAWESVRESCKRDDIVLFQARYAETYFGDLARKRIDDISAMRVCTAQLRPAGTDPSAAVAATPAATLAPPNLMEDETFVRAMQTELSRVGCLDGAVDGKWGEKSESAFQLYVKHTRLGEVTSQSALVALRQARSRVCPLQCDQDEFESNGKCMAKPNKESATEAAKRNGAMRGSW